MKNMSYWEDVGPGTMLGMILFGLGMAALSYWLVGQALMGHT